MEKLYSIAETAEKIGLSIPRIQVLCRQGRFPGAIKVGRAWVVPESAIQGYTPGQPGRPKPPRMKDILQEAGILPPPKDN